MSNNNHNDNENKAPKVNVLQVMNKTNLKKLENVATKPMKTSEKDKF